MGSRLPGERIHRRRTRHSRLERPGRRPGSRRFGETKHYRSGTSRGGLRRSDKKEFVGLQAVSDVQPRHAGALAEDYHDLQHRLIERLAER
jgi:hypothetical protein